MDEKQAESKKSTRKNQEKQNEERGKRKAKHSLVQSNPGPSQLTPLTPNARSLSPFFSLFFSFLSFSLFFLTLSFLFSPSF